MDSARAFWRMTPSWSASRGQHAEVSIGQTDGGGDVRGDPRANRVSGEFPRVPERHFVGIQQLGHTVHYARALADTPIKANGPAPGHVATAFNNLRGTRTPEQGAAVALRLATLPAEGPTGVVFEDHTQLTW